MTFRGRARLCMLALAALVAGCTAAPAADPVTVTAGTTTVPAVSSSSQPPSRSVPVSSSSPTAPRTTTKPSVKPSTRSSAAPPAGPTTQAYVQPADLAKARQAVAAMSVAERAGSVLMADSSTVLGTDRVAGLHLGGVILMGSRGVIDGTDGGTPTEVADVTATLQRQVTAGAPLLIGTDQEYGDVTRLEHGFTAFPGASVLGAIPDTAQAVDLTGKIAAAAGTELLAVGINVDFAPDADLLPREGASAIGNRSYGSDPGRTGQLVAAAVGGYQRSGVAATIKHFPGIGSIAADTHDDLPTLEDDCAQWNSTDSVPMAAGVKAGAALAMTGHVLVPAVGVDQVAASVSRNVVTDLLRGPGRNGCRALGFTGVAVTDSLQMAPIANNFSSGQAAVRALLAGQDLLLMPVNPQTAVDGIVAAVANGSLPASRLADAAVRVYALRLALSRVKRPDLSVVNSAAHQQLADEARSAAAQ